MLRLSSPSRPSPDVILLVTVAELVGLGDDPRLHRRLAETKVPQRSQREPPLSKKWTFKQNQKGNHNDL